MKDKANEIIKFYNSNNVTRIIDYLGIILLKSNLGNVKGFLQFYNNRYIIHVNHNIENESEIDMVIAHELAHYFLHKNMNCFEFNSNSLYFEDKIEKEANLFASELLLTDNMLLEEFIYLESFTIKDISNYFNLCYELVELKFETLKLDDSFFKEHKEHTFEGEF